MALYVSWQYINCPYCGEPIPKNEFHICNKRVAFCHPLEGIEARVQQVKQSTMEEAEEKYKQAMRESIEHLKKCTTCRYLSTVDGSVCVDMRKLRDKRNMLLIEKETL